MSLAADGEVPSSKPETGKKKYHITHTTQNTNNTYNGEHKFIYINKNKYRRVATISLSHTPARGEGGNHDLERDVSNRRGA